MHDGRASAATPTASPWTDGRTERRAQTAAIRALRTCDAPLAAANVIAAQACEALGAVSAMVVAVGAGGARVVAGAGAGAEPGDAIAPEVTAALEGTPVVAFRDRRAPSSPMRRPEALVAVPIRLDGRVWGALAAGTGGRTPDEAVDVLTPFAELMTLALATDASHRRLAELAATDELTGLANRRAFDAALARACRTADRDGAPMSVAFIDIDRFKQVNDRLGHRVGDEVLAEVARRLRRAARVDDVVARVGGEEFGWILPGLDASWATVALERARRAVSAAPVGGAGHLTVSAGVADLHAAGSPTRMLELADAMLYRAKADGRDAVRPSPVLSAAG